MEPVPSQGYIANPTWSPVSLFLFRGTRTLGHRTAKVLSRGYYRGP